LGVPIAYSVRRLRIDCQESHYPVVIACVIFCTYRRDSISRAQKKGIVMAQGSIHGRFVWQELTTEDPATAVSFYSKVVGWHAHSNPSHPTYTEFGIGSSHHAGMMALTDDARAAGVRSNWQPYIGAADVDSTAAAAQKLGGKVAHPAQNIEHVGRFAVLNDPQGGVFALFKPAGAGSSGPAATATVPVGAFAWQELATSDYEAAFEFYSKLFGWQVIQRMDMGPQGVYLIFGADGVPHGGMYKMHQERSSRPYWLPYAEVASADAAAAVAAAAGGRIIVGPMEVPGGGRMAQVLDPSGAMFALHSAAKAAAPSKPAAKPAAPKPAAAKPAPAAPTAAKAPAPPAAKPAAAKPAAAKPAAAKPAPKKAAAKKRPVAKKKKAAAKRKPLARKKKAPARKSAAKYGRKPARKSAKKSAKKAARKGAAGRKKPAKARRKK
jgi:predicted enzyme related to lactoylglutathione lyase